MELCLSLLIRFIAAPSMALVTRVVSKVQRLIAVKTHIIELSFSSSDLSLCAVVAAGQAVVLH
jgi:hypothetical protein